MENIDINESYIVDFIEQIRPQDLNIRKQLDFGYTYNGKEVLLFTKRPRFNVPSETLNLEFAKLKYIKSRKIWKIYWLRASGKWESYEPFPSTASLVDALKVIKKDNLGCFFG